MKRNIQYVIMLTFIIAVGSPHTAQAQDSIFTRLKNNIIDTLYYRKLSLTASALGLGCAFYSSNPTVRRVLGSLSLLNVLRTWCQAPNRYTLEGIAEKAAHDVIGFSWILLDGKPSKEINQTRINLILAMNDMAKDQNNELKNDVLALTLIINKKFEERENILKGEKEASNQEERLLVKTILKEGDVDLYLARDWKRILNDFFDNPSKIKNDADFKNIRSKFNSLAGIVEIASLMNNPNSRPVNMVYEGVPRKNYWYYRNMNNTNSHIKKDGVNYEEVARDILIQSLETLQNRAPDDGLKADIDAFINVASQTSLDDLDKLIKQPDTIKQNEDWKYFRNNPNATNSRYWEEEDDKK